MLCFLMGGGRVGRAITLHQDEPGRVILLLDDIEPGNTSFLDALPRVREGRLLKRLDRFRLHMNVNVNN